MHTDELRRALKEALYQAELLAVTTNKRRHRRWERKIEALLEQVKTNDQKGAPRDKDTDNP